MGHRGRHRQPIPEDARRATTIAGSHTLGMLEDTDVLVCDLRHHHPRDGRPYSYSLCGIERAWTSDALVCRPIVDWQLDTPITPTTATPQVGQAASTTGTDETPRTS
jgi:hypothetical protein